MMGNRWVVRKAAVLGAGVMGSQIAAHLTNVGIPTILYDLPSEEGPFHQIAQTAVKKLLQIKPSPLVLPELLTQIEVADYEHSLAKLSSCDLIIEAIAERMDLKLSLYEKIIPHLASNACLVTNTSGLSVEKLAKSLPESLRPRFCGVHFFNPPRYMRLIEIIPNTATDVKMCEALETLLVCTLGKSIIYAKDTPNFIANRVGVFSLLATTLHAERFKIDLEVVDALTGPIISRAKSATFRTADVVGLDTFAHVVKTMFDQLKSDPWHGTYRLPGWMEALIKKGALGQKTQCGIYKKEGKDLKVLDVVSGDYRVASRQPEASIIKILKEKNPAERFKQLKTSNHPQAQFLWACFRDLFHYCAFHAESIAETIRDIDCCLRWGFAWGQGPFELWQEAGWEFIQSLLKDDIDNKATLANVPLPTWVQKVSPLGVYRPDGAFCPREKNFKGRSTLPVYKKHLYPAKCPQESFDTGITISENKDIRLWHTGDGIAILSFKSKMNTASSGVLQGIIDSVLRVENDFRALILWQTEGEHFCVGANLKEFYEDLTQGRLSRVEDTLKLFQRASLALRYSAVPTIAAVKGMALGGGCELAMHCSRLVAAFEVYLGLVEVGVGLLPAGGGCKEFAWRANQWSRGCDLFRLIQPLYLQIAKGETSQSAADAMKRGFMRESDVIVNHPDELLYVAKIQAEAMINSGYRPPLKPNITVVGQPGIAKFQSILINMREGEFISDHDYLIGCKIARVICGGEVDPLSIVTEDWLLQLEREEFLSLAGEVKTQNRIIHMLENGKPLRN